MASYGELGRLAAAVRGRSQRTRAMAGMGPWGGACALGIVLVSSGAAQAQARGPGLERLAVEVHARTTYDTNVAGGDDTVAAVRQLEPDDVIYEAGGTISLRAPSTRHTLFVTGSGDIRRHQNNKSLNGEQYQFTAGAGTTFSTCEAILTGSISRRQSLAEDLTLPVRNNNADTQSADIAVDCTRGNFTGGIQASVSKLENSAKSSGFVDSDSRNVAINVGYRGNAIGDIGLTANFNDVDYADDGAASNFALVSRGFEQSGVGIYYSRKAGRRLSGKASASYVTLRPAGAAKSTAGLTAEASLAYQPTARSQVSLSYQLANQASPTANAAYVRTEFIQIEGDHSLSKRVSLRLGASRGRESYKEGQLLPFQIQDNRRTAVFGGVSWRVGRRLTLTLDGNYTKRDADVEQFDFSSGRVTFGIVGKI